MTHWASLTDPQALIPPDLYPVLSGDAMRAEPKPVPVRQAKPRRQKKPMAQHLRGRFERSFRNRLMLLLGEGSMDRRAFRAIAGQLARDFDLRGKDAIAHAINALVNDGLMSCEVRLTAKGLHKLGLKGPQ
jgi:hypothetical protein